MKITAINTTIAFTVESTTTLKELLLRDDVTEALGMEYYDALELVSEYNGAAVGAFSSDIKASLSITDSTEISIDAEIDMKEEEQVTAEDNSAGLVSIYKAMDSVKDIPIVNGVTRVADILTATVANRFGTTVDNLFNMEITINDVKACTTATLTDGDVVNVTPLKAGSNGAIEKVIVMCNDRESNASISVDVEKGASLKSIYDRLKEVGVEVSSCIYTFNGEGLPSSIDGYTFAVEHLYFATPMSIVVFNGSDIKNSFHKATEEEEEEENPFDDAFDSEDEYDDDGEILANEDEEDLEYTSEDGSVYAGPAEGVAGTVSVRYSIDQRPFDIVNKVTTLGDVVFSTRMLNLQGINLEQAKGLRYLINDVVETDYDAKLEIGDLIEICPIPAGKNG